MRPHTSMFSIDNWLNAYIPPSQVHKLPRLLRRLAGGHNPPAQHDAVVLLDILVSSFCGIAVIAAVFKSHTVFTQHHAPLLLASYGASAILTFNASLAPLSQPRNVIVGHFFAAVIGTGIQKLFALSAAGRDNYWASGALSVAVSLVFMAVFNCVHPPAGALALLPSVDEDIRMVGWWVLPIHLVLSVLIVAVTCVTVNFWRVYPTCWWSLGVCGKYWQQRTPDADLEKLELDVLEPENAQPVTSLSLSGLLAEKPVPHVYVLVDKVVIPEGLVLDELEVQWLETLQRRIYEMQIETPVLRAPGPATQD